VLVFFGLVFVVYTCVFPYMARMNNPNENVRTYMTMALVEEHSLRIDEMVARYGWVNDMARAPDKKTGEFHRYSLKGPAVSYAGVPVYWLFKKIAPRFKHPLPTRASLLKDKVWWFRASTLVLRLFTIQLPCFAFLVWLERWLRATTSDTVLRLTAVAAVGLGTNYLAYSMMFASHAPFAVAAFGSFALTTSERMRAGGPARMPRWLVAVAFFVGAAMAAAGLRHQHIELSHRILWVLVPVGLGTVLAMTMAATLPPSEASETRASRAFLAGLLAGLATLLEYHALPVSIALSLYAMTTFWRPQRLVAFGIGGALNAATLMHFQWRAFGSPFTPGHRMSDNPVFAALLNKGYFGIGQPSYEVAKNITISHSYGFFGTSPFMVLGLLAIPFTLGFAYGKPNERRQRRVATVAWMFAMMVLWTTVSAAINWRGGWTVGPRYLGAAPPFFAYGAVCALEQISGTSLVRRALARAVAGGCAVASVAQTGLVSLITNAIPESVTRPLPQIALPMARTGFVPHHAGELFGWMAPWFWYGVAACLAVAVLLAALVPWEDRVYSWLIRLVVCALVANVAIGPAFSAPDKVKEPTDPNAIRYFVDSWEPPDRDFIHRAREQAERLGPRGPCAWYKVADLERIVMLPWDREEKRALEPRSACP
jgi:hypothetical protein